MVYYRKYRPQQIKDLDSLDVQQKLYAVLASNTPHAFLFTGPKGLGKTSTARIVAKAVNCQRKAESVKGKEEKQKDLNASRLTLSANIEPCNTCDSCVSITNGTNLDVLEIDAASNRGIDEIRELKEKIRLAPVSAKKKVYIIDEVHMLTTEAFNALLKTLEEPPSHAMFILCTTEIHKVPATIVSRCFHLSFKPATEEELVRSFTRIAQGEGIEITQDALVYIAQLSDRGFRDGAKILEEVVSLAEGKEITLSLVEETYKVSSISYFVSSMVDALGTLDMKEALQIISRVVEEGFDIRYFLQELMETLHGILLADMDIQNTKYKIQNTKLNLEQLKVLFELFSKAYADMKYAVVPQLPMELAVIEYTSEKSPQPPLNKGGDEALPPLRKGPDEGGRLPFDHELRAEWLDRGGSVPQDGGFASLGVTRDEGVSVSSLRKQVGVIQKNKALYGEPKVVADTKPAVEISKVELMKALSNGEVTKEWQDLFWRSLITEMKQHNHTIVGVLRGCEIKQYADKTLTIQTPYAFHKEKLDEMKNHQTLSKVCKILTGNDVEINVELKNS